MPITYITNQRDRDLIDAQIVLLARIVASKTGKDLSRLISWVMSEDIEVVEELSEMDPTINLIGDVVFKLEQEWTEITTDAFREEKDQIEFLLEFIKREVLLGGLLSYDITVDITSEF